MQLTQPLNSDFYFYFGIFSFQEFLTLWISSFDLLGLDLGKIHPAFQWTKTWATKAELLQVGIFFLIHLFEWAILLLKKLEI